MRPLAVGGNGDDDDDDDDDEELVEKLRTRWTPLFTGEIKDFLKEGGESSFWAA
jgi:hypothetical protein